MSEEPGFLSRWSRRKVQARQGVAPEEPAPNEPVAVVPTPVAADPAAPLPAQSVDTAGPHDQGEPAKPPPPTLADVAQLTRESDFSRFVAPGVDGQVKNAALQKLFADPHFNVMDGLDVYIDDYNKPDPLPLASIRKMAQAAFLGLVEATPPAAAAPDPAHPPTAQAPKSAEVDVVAQAAATPEPDENADLRLQPHDAAGCGGAEDGAAADERRQS
ncbi:MAG: DUF3306 domain-containing protein [Burkholderiaceae bacterium]|nr:DUF3306 domain-containing protein [Burkholderiaceae bacterium]